MQPLTSQKTIAQEREPTWFNWSVQLSGGDEERDPTADGGLHLPGHECGEHADNARDRPSSSLFEVARLAAVAGEQKQAVDLLLLWRRSEIIERTWTQGSATCVLIHRVTVEASP